MGSKETTTELLTEHFRYTPVTLLDDFINAVNELVFRAVNAVEDGLSERTAEELGFSFDDAVAPSYPNDHARSEALSELKNNEIGNGIVKLESLLNATVDKDFDKFEIYTLRNILAVGHEEDDLANWVQLDHYKGLEVVNADTVPTPEQVQLQRSKLHETAKLNAMLKAEEAKNAAILSQLSTLIEGAEGMQDEQQAPFAFLKSAGAPYLTQDTQQALAQVPALQKLLAHLKEAVQIIPDARQGRYDEENSAEGRRRRYLEKQGRRALERRGIDPDSAPSASLAPGRRMGRDELEGIESIAQAFGGADDTANK